MRVGFVAAEEADRVFWVCSSELRDYFVDTTGWNSISTFFNIKKTVNFLLDIWIVMRAILGDGGRITSRRSTIFIVSVVAMVGWARFGFEEVFWCRL